MLSGSGGCSILVLPLEGDRHDREFKWAGVGSQRPAVRMPHGYMVPPATHKVYLQSLLIAAR